MPYWASEHKKNAAMTATTWQKSTVNPTTSWYAVPTEADRAILGCALSYLEGNLSIIPLKLDWTKSPALAEWKPYQLARATPEDVERWLTGPYKGRGIGIVCGAVSGNLEVIDFDDYKTFERFRGVLDERHPGLIGIFTLVRTPRPGMHLWYRCDVVEGPQKLARRKTGELVKTLVETRGEGSYVAAPGSPASIHNTGRLYEFIQGDQWAIPRITPEQRDALHGIARELNEYEDPAEVGFDYVPTSTNDGTDRLYCFSSSITALPTNRYVDKFGAYARLHHGGDFAAATKALTAGTAR